MKNGKNCELRTQDIHKQSSLLYKDIPSSMCSSSNLHFRIDRTLHVFLAGWTIVILIALAQLTTGIRQRVPIVHQVPVILIAGIVQNGLLQALRQKRRQIDQSVLPAQIHVRLAQIEGLVGHAVVCHDGEGGQQIGRLVDFGRLVQLC